MSEKYSVHDHTVEQILNFIKSNEIAIPEIQRPFVWKGKQVRDLVKSQQKDLLATDIGFCRNFFTASIDFLLKIPDNITKHILEVPYVM